MAPQVDLVQLAPLVLGQPALRLEVEDAERRHPGLVRDVVQQELQLGQWEIAMGLGDGEEITHPQADGHLALG